MDHCMDAAFTQCTTEPVSLSSLQDCRVAMLAVHRASASLVPPSAQLSFISLHGFSMYRGQEQLSKKSFPGASQASGEVFGQRVIGCLTQPPTGLREQSFRLSGRRQESYGPARRGSSPGPVLACEKPTHKLDSFRLFHCQGCAQAHNGFWPLHILRFRRLLPPPLMASLACWT